MQDIVLPQNNEAILKKQAHEFDSDLNFVYQLDSIKSGCGLIIHAINVRDINRARQKARNARFVIANASDESVIRAIMEAKWIKFFTDIETSTGRDHTHYRRSNFNQVLAKLARDTNKSYIVNFSSLLKVQGKKRSLLIGRIMQNIRICQKFKVPISIATFASNPYELRNPKDLQAVLRAFKTKKIADVEKLLSVS